MSYQGLGWTGAVAMEGQPVLVDLPLEEWSTIAAASAYSYLQPLLQPKIEGLLDQARSQLIDYGLQQARIDADSARREAFVGTMLVLGSIWGAAWWIRRKRS